MARTGKDEVGDSITASPPRLTKTAAEGPRGRRYGFACSNCRRRKAKCDGAFPACQKCCTARETCSYDKRPSVAFAVTLQRQLKAYEARFEELRIAQGSERDQLLSKPVVTEQLRGGKARANSPPGAIGLSRQLTPDTTRSESGADGAVADTITAAEDANGLGEEVSIDDEGQVNFYGQTSLYRAEEQGSHHEGTSPSNREAISPRTYLLSGPQSRESERTYMGEFLAEIDISLLNDVLETYWCWPHHLHCVLVKKVFERDLHNLGPYVTPFLLSAVLAQAARYSIRPDAERVGNYFAMRATQLLVGELDRGSSIPTVQGLLIFSARECACGRTSQGWLYSGMAFRMGRDLGLQVAPKKLSPLASHFSEEELGLRQQLFWSCYTWDKTMSLCLGRPAIISDTIELPSAETLLDGYDADNEIWKPTPLQGTRGTHGMSIPGRIVQHQSLSSTRFAAYCELCVIIHNVLDKLYSRPHHRQRDHMMAYLTQTLKSLDDWSSRLPAGLYVRGTTKAMVCPPLHILLLNLVYHTAVILLCRPYRAVADVARARCTDAARMTDDLMTLHVRRFGFRCITWLQTYTIFVACTINVRDYKESQAKEGQQAVRPEDIALSEEASARLDFGLEILRQAETTPSAGRCADIILRWLRSSGGGSHHAEQTTPNGNLNMHSPKALPHHQHRGSMSHPSAENVNGRDRPPMALVNTEAEMTVSIDPSQAASQMALPSNIAVAQVPVSQPSPVSSFPLSNTRQAQVGELISLENGSGLETPFRWLPENMCDDGSWMLTDLDLNSGSIFRMPTS